MDDEETPALLLEARKHRDGLINICPLKELHSLNEYKSITLRLNVNPLKTERGNIAQKVSHLTRKQAAAPMIL